ncbi:MAG: hypothetical protein GX428_05170 [Candidatus Atribacteria bacterium]|nr:hypothetical protein [Candidatus Atribacteria bacterium]
MNPTTMRFMNNVYTDITGSFGDSSNQTLGMSGDGGCYADGNVIGTLSPGTPTQLTTKFGINGIYLANYDYGIPDLSILGLWIYNIALTAQQVAGLTGAINALTSAGNYYL